MGPMADLALSGRAGFLDVLGVKHTVVTVLKFLIILPLYFYFVSED